MHKLSKEYSRRIRATSFLVFLGSSMLAVVPLYFIHPFAALLGMVPGLIAYFSFKDWFTGKLTGKELQKQKALVRINKLKA